jgi:hypothetical protein
LLRQLSHVLIDDLRAAFDDRTGRYARECPDETGRPVAFVADANEPLPSPKRRDDVRRGG